MSKTLIVSDSIYKESVATLEKMGYTLVFLKSVNWLEKPISSHPDMFMAQMFGKTFYDKNINDLFINADTLDFDCKSLIPCDREVPHSKILEYPNNISFNCVSVGNKLICYEKFTCNDILSFAQNAGVETLNVKQGYAKCSTCVVSDNAIITDDESIAQCAERNGIDVLRVQKGCVKLDGYDYGFIGGCSGLIEKNLVVFNGNINYHPNCAEIAEFCYKHSTEIVNLCDKPLYDIGTIMKI